MKINIDTKLNIGDKVYVVVYDFIAEEFPDHMVIHKSGFEKYNGGYAVIETEVSHIRIFEDLCIQYFFKGFTSFEGENWFYENQRDDIIGSAWFFDKEDAILISDLFVESEDSDIDKTTREEYRATINRLVISNNYHE